MHVHVNAAMSVDGKLSTRERVQLPISSDTDFGRVDELRAAVDAIVVGVGTVLADDPSLTVDGTADPPVRVVLDSRARTPPEAAILEGEPDTILCVSDRAAPGDRAALTEAGASFVTAGAERVDPIRAFAVLSEEFDVDRVLVEGGGELIFSLFESHLVDELSVYVGPLVIGGRDAPSLADGDGFIADFPALTLEAVERLGDGVLLEYSVP